MRSIEHILLVRKKNLNLIFNFKDEASFIFEKKHEIDNTAQKFLGALVMALAVLVNSYHYDG